MEPNSSIVEGDYCEHERHGIQKLFNVNLLSGDGMYSNERVQFRQEQLQNLVIVIQKHHSQGECSQLTALLAQYHDVFSLEDE